MENLETFDFGYNKWRPTQNRNYAHDLGGYFWMWAPGGRRVSKNNLQLLYRRKNQFKQKLRRRKFKMRVFNKSFIRRTSRGLAYPIRSGLVGLRANNACRLSYPMLIAAEKAVMPTKQKVWVKHRKYPDYFVTKKSSKSRMGKGKGKIFGRVLKIKKGEVVFDMGVSHIRKSRKWLGALKLVIPTTTRVVYKSRWVYRRIKDYFRNRAWLSFKRKEKKKKFYQIEAKKFIFMLQAKGESKFLKTIGPESFYRYKTFGFKASKGHTEAMMQIYGLSSSRVASQLSIMDKLHKFGILGAKRNFKSGHSSAGASGGHLRSHLQILYLAKHFTRAFYEQEWMPDADGYYGFYRGANKVMKRKLKSRETSAFRHNVARADYY